MFYGPTENETRSFVAVVGKGASPAIRISVPLNGMVISRLLHPRKSPKPSRRSCQYGLIIVFDVAAHDGRLEASASGAGWQRGWHPATDRCEGSEVYMMMMMIDGFYL